MTDETKVWTQEDAILDALQRHPDCKHAEVRNGMNAFFGLTWVVELWRNDECWYSNDPPKYTEQGYAAR
jgi:hypothetical protein